MDKLLMEKDLKWIKKHYGETMMHLCRSLFPRILETENLLPMLLEQHFPHSRNLAKDILEQDGVENFKDYIHSLINVEEKERVKTSKSAVQLMKDAGYILFPECKTEKEIQSYKKYWTDDEQLCTFNGGRLNTCRVWFAVKENIEDIKREDFKNPSRQDAYGTSAISIQFEKSENHNLSIKNRYNHTVKNPDNTFYSDLDNIIPGLTYAFERDYGAKSKYNYNTYFELENYVEYNGKFYHYNYEIDNVYYCDDNTIIDYHGVTKLPPHQILIDYYIFDKSKNTVSLYNEFYLKDCFPKTLGEIEKMEFSRDEIVLKVKDGKDVKIGIDYRHRIVSYENENLTSCGNELMMHNTVLSNLNVPNLVQCGKDCFESNIELKTLSAPKLEKCGDNFFQDNEKISQIYLPNLKECGNSFMLYNKDLKELNLPKLEICGHDFVQANYNLTQVNLPKLKQVGDYFLYSVSIPKEISFPNLEKCGDNFLYMNVNLSDINMPNLKECGQNFLFYNSSLTELDLPNLEKFGSNFLKNNSKIEDVNIPNASKYSIVTLKNKKLQKMLATQKSTFRNILDRFLGR